MRPLPITRALQLALNEFNAGTARARRAAQARDDWLNAAPRIPTRNLCADCAETGVIEARGLCRSCYKRHYRAGTLDNYRRQK